MTELSPYDTGARLEPHVWVRDDTASPGGLPRRATESDYGRVDFDADDGTTILTLSIERAANGYQLHIDSHSDDYLHVVGANEPPKLYGPSAELDVEYRTRQMMLLDAALTEIGNTYREYIFYNGEGDTTAFSPGHFVFYPFDTNDHVWFAIEELYEDGAHWKDEERIPIGWAWHESGPVRLPDGTTRGQRVAEGTTLPSDIDNLADRARSWARTIFENAAADEAADREQRRQQFESLRDHPTR